MAGRFVRASKYRHVFGQPTRKEQCYDNLHISKNAWDSNIVKANPQYLAVNWEASGGGAFAVIPLEERGKLPERLPLFRGHTAPVLDTDWNPFNDSLIASGSDDAKVFLWRVPDGFSTHAAADGEDPVDVQPVGRLTGHTRKVGHVLFNPSAENVLASSSGDYTIKIWDIEKGAAPLTLKHPDIVQSLSWSADGALLVTTCRDKKLRLWDARQEKPVQENPGHSGAKNSRAVWMGEHDRIATTGFSKMSDRQLALWDIKNPSEPLGGFTTLDSISGVCMPFWDDGTQCLYLAGKGDGNIRYFEYADDKFEYLSEYKSTDPQRGIAFVPKRGVNVQGNEVMRAFKTVNDAYIEPISFVVPRRSEVFQEDIYPPTIGSKPAMSSGDWFGGKNGMPPKISLESVYDGASEPKEVASDYKPRAAMASTVKTPAPTKTEPEPPKPAAAPAPTSAPAAASSTPSSTSRGAPSDMKTNKDSISAMANKYVDQEPDADSSDESSFEEIAKPVERPSVTAAKQEEKTQGPPMKIEPASNKSSASPSPTKAPAASAAPTTTQTQSVSSSSSAPVTASSVAASAAQGLRGELQEIKDMQNRTLALLEAQARAIERLTAEVEQLKAK